MGLASYFGCDPDWLAGGDMQTASVREDAAEYRAAAQPDRIRAAAAALDGEALDAHLVEMCQRMTREARPMLRLAALEAFLSILAEWEFRLTLSLQH